MPAWAQSQGGPLTDAQISMLVEGMESNWAKPVNTNGSLLPTYDGAELTGDVAHGRKLFARNCFACHAQGGVAGALLDPSYLALSSNQNLRTSIIVGRPDFPGIQMPDYRSLNSGHALADQDIADLVSFLSSKRPANSPMAMAEVKNVNSTEMSKTHTKE
jgi:mono/diheme cytochrome c family protein